ncbi:uncharacterized protein A4U43_C03F60 [Asparagus officinalis]|uniref:Uncharacterized protein n=1 Tax=Asparagus officinalis TaxID=4686 RepID=A0A5P1F6U4_ASPOF|nr:uncharacterized protein A4U43_C03F60 [Asparagus officinalis]
MSKNLLLAALIRWPLRPILRKDLLNRNKKEKKDEEPQIKRKDEAEKEDDQGKEMEEVKDDRVDMGIEVEEPEEVKVIKEVTKKKRGRKRREERDKTLKEFIQGLRAKSQRTTKKPKFLESPFQTVIPKKRSEGKKVVVVVKDDEDKREKEEEKEFAISYTNMRTSVEELWKGKKLEKKNIIGDVEYGHSFSARL